MKRARLWWWKAIKNSQALHASHLHSEDPQDEAAKSAEAVKGAIEGAKDAVEGAVKNAAEGKALEDAVKGPTEVGLPVKAIPVFSVGAPVKANTGLASAATASAVGEPVAVTTASTVADD